MRKLTNKQRNFISDWKKLEAQLDKKKISLKVATQRGMKLKKRFLMK